MTSRYSVPLLHPFAFRPVTHYFHHDVATRPKSSDVVRCPNEGKCTRHSSHCRRQHDAHSQQRSTSAEVRKSPTYVTTVMFTEHFSICKRSRCALFGHLLQTKIGLTLVMHLTHQLHHRLATRLTSLLTHQPRPVTNQRFHKSSMRLAAIAKSLMPIRQNHRICVCFPTYPWRLTRQSN